MKSQIVLMTMLTLLRTHSAVADQYIGAEMAVAEKMLADMGLSRRPDLQHVSGLLFSI